MRLSRFRSRPVPVLLDRIRRIGFPGIRTVAVGWLLTVGAILGVGLAAIPEGLVRSLAAQEPVPEVVSADGDTRGERPVPVLLVPGWGDGSEELIPLQTRFREAGWPLGAIRAVDFEDPVGSSRAHAQEVAAAVRALRRTTDSEVVDIVAHSMGGLAVRRFLQSRDSTGVRKVVFLGTPHRGTVAAWFAWGEGGDEMQPGSPFLDSLNAGGFVPDDVRALAIQTPLDLRVIPGESAVLPDAANTRNEEICCPTHPGLLDHDETFQAVVEFLGESDEDER